jgi:hypothetical protein
MLMEVCGVCVRRKMIKKFVGSVAAADREGQFNRTALSNKASNSC